MGWTAPLTANTGDDFTANWENGDRANTLWVVRPLVRLPETVDAVNVPRDVETDLLGGLLSLPGGALGTKGMLRVSMVCDIQNADHSDTGFHYRLRVGEVEVWNSNSGSHTAKDRRHVMLVKFYIAACGSASSIFAAGYIKFSDVGTAVNPVTGLGQLSDVVTDAQGPYIIPWGSAGKLSTVDTADDQLVQFTFTSNHQDLRLSARCLWAAAELVGQAA